MARIKELEEVKEALNCEKEEERKQYEKLMRDTGISDRVKQGACWYPLMIEREAYGLGEHPYIIVERTKNRDKPHKFRSGQVVRVFSQQTLPEESSALGVINFVDRNRMKVIFYSEDHPEWLSKGKLGLDLSFDERSYKEMDRAINKLLETEDEHLIRLRDVLLGKRPAEFEDTHKFSIAHLNAAQNEAIQLILSAKDVAVVHGPPGTGKTTTLVHAVQQLAKTENTILVCAPSNAAVDLLTERLAEQGLNVVRTGNISRVDESILKHTLDGHLAGRPEMSEVKKLKQEAAKCRKDASKYKRSFGPKERELRRMAWREAKSLSSHAKLLEEYVIDKIIGEADVVACTLVSSNGRFLENKTFKTVVIDEAAQALEPASWISILKAQKVVFAGDPFQLPPMIKSSEAAKKGLNVTLMEKCINKLDKVQLLNIQYRMHETIMGFSNQQFYENKLVAADFVRYRTLNMTAGNPHPLEFVDTAGCGFDEKINKENQSRYNPEEYGILRQHLDALLTYTEDELPEIGIISPYREQVVQMKSSIKTDFDHFPEAQITVDTIDSFQGQERDVIYISMVRSNTDGDIGFLKDFRRMNVAMTRAKKKLVIIGDSATLATYSFYKDFIDYCEKTDSYRSAWEWMNV